MISSTGQQFRILRHPTQALMHRMRSDSLLRNSLYMMSTTVVTSLLGYVYWIVAARTYSAHDVGLAAALISVMTLASTLCSVGLSSALVQALPSRASGRAWSLAFNAGLASGTVSGLLVGVLALVMLPLFSHQFAIVGHSITYILVLVASVPLWTAATILDAAFVAERASGHMLVRSTVYSMAKIPLLVIPLLIRAGPLGIVSSWVVATAVGSFSGFLLMPRLGRRYTVTLRGLGGHIRSMLSAFAGHHLINLGGLAPMYLLPTCIVARLSATDNAYFYTTWMLGLLFFMVSSSVATSLFAEGSHAADGIGQKVRSSIAIIGTLLGPAMVIFLLGGRYILAVFGSHYPRHGLLLLTLLVVSALPDAITNIYVSVLRVQRRLVLAAGINLGMAILCLTLAWKFLPTLGIAGAGWAWLGAQAAGSIAVGVHVGIAHRTRRIRRLAGANNNRCPEARMIASLAFPTTNDKG